MAVTHAFVSAKSDGGDATVVRPSNWNANHTITGTLAWDGATVTADTPLLNLTQTWNNAAVAFNGIKLNITDTPGTTSDYGSKLLDLQVGGSTRFSVDGRGIGIIYAALSNSSNRTAIANYGASTGVVIGSPDFLGFTAGAWYDAITIKLTFDASGTLAQRNSTNAQTFCVYNTYTDASNYERGVLNWTTTSNTLTIGAEKAGTGTIRDVQFVGSGKFTFVSPSSSVTPTNNGDLVIQATSNTSLTFKYKGSDGTVRSASLTLT